MLNRGMLAALLFVAAFAAAQGDAVAKLAPEDRAYWNSVNKPVIMKAAGMEQVRVDRDLSYKSTDGQRLKADVYHAAKRSGKAPIVILIHGGVGPEFPIRPKDWGFYKSYGRWLAASGFTAVTFNHSAGFPKVEIPHAAQDLKDVIQFARSHSGEWKADGERICLMTFSGGGPLLSVAMGMHAEYIRCQIGMYPILDIQNTKVFEGQLNPEEMVDYSPVEQVVRNPGLPLLIARAGKDQIPQLLTGLDRFVGIALKSDADVTVLNNPGAPHGFENKSETAQTSMVMRLVVEFLNEHLHD
jgi:acetyl esterase/lipase